MSCGRSGKLGEDGMIAIEYAILYVGGVVRRSAGDLQITRTHTFTDFGLDYSFRYAFTSM